MISPISLARLIVALEVELQQAIASNFSDRGLLQQSLQAFQRALGQQPDHAVALCGMAYLLALCGDTVKARQFACRVLEQDLDDPLAQSLWTCLAGLRPAANWAASVHCDLDAQYEALEKLLKSSLRIYSQNRLPTQLGPEPELRLGLQRSHDELELLLRKVDASLAVIEAEIDASALVQLSRPLQVMLKQLNAQLLAQDEHDRLWRNVQQGSRVNKELLASRSDLHARLEQLLDACDAVADGIDVLDNAGWKMPALLAAYRAWMAEIQVLQEVIDESP